MALSDNQTRALALVADFRTHSVGVWPNLNRSDVADGLEVRIADPTRISSAHSSLCGAASVIYELATADPVAYAQAAINLYESGQATIRSLIIKPSSTLRSGILPAQNDAADWLVLGSLRDSENWLFTYKENGHWWDDVKAIQLPHTVATWMQRFGYSDIRNETNLMFTKGWDNLVEANNFYGKGYKVSLFINSCMMYSSSQDEISAVPDHWIGMASKATSSTIHADPHSKFKISVFSWGKIQAIPVDPSVPMHPKVFLQNYYGYVAGKP